MKRFADFVKTCIIGGLVGILPILLAVLLVMEAIDILSAITGPIAEQLPIDELGGVEIATVVALLMILAACFLVGLVLRTRIGVASTRLVEDAVLNRLPGYTLLKTASRRIGGVEEGAVLSAGLADLHGSDSRAIVLIVEEHDDGAFTVLVPNAPTPTIGALYVLPAGRVTRLPASTAAVFNCFTQWGMGSKQLLDASG